MGLRHAEASCGSVGCRSGFTPRWFAENRSIKPLLQFAFKFMPTADVAENTSCPQCLHGGSDWRSFAPMSDVAPLGTRATRFAFALLNRKIQFNHGFSADFADGRGCSSIPSALIRVISGKVIPQFCSAASSKIHCRFGGGSAAPGNLRFKCARSDYPFCRPSRNSAKPLKQTRSRTHPCLKAFIFDSPAFLTL